jgi:hypothetical protein
MAVLPMAWTGDNLIEIADCIGHDRFWHKKGVLIVLNGAEIVYVPKGSRVEKDGRGNVIGKVAPENLELSIVTSAQRLLGSVDINVNDERLDDV